MNPGIQTPSKNIRAHKDVASSIVELLRGTECGIFNRTSWSRQHGFSTSSVSYAISRLIDLGIAVNEAGTLKLTERYLEGDSWRAVFGKKVVRKSKDQVQRSIEDIHKSAEADKVRAAAIITICEEIQTAEARRNKIKEEAEERMAEMDLSIREARERLTRLQAGDADALDSTQEHIKAFNDFSRRGPLMVRRLVVDDKAGGAVLTSLEAANVGNRGPARR